MTSEEYENLRAIIHRYGEVANAVNRREMERFANEVKSKWNPPPESEDPEPRLDGYTDTGALDLHIFQLMFFPCMPPPRIREPLREAEQHDQVLLQPPALLDYIEKPLSDPATPELITTKFTSLKAQLRKQMETSGGTEPAEHFELPEDFGALMSLTDGIGGAGVPSETAYTCLVAPLQQHSAGPDHLQRISHYVKSRDMGIALAAWRFGGCIQHRNIYYVLCQSANTASPSWKIFDLHLKISLDIFDGLAEFIRHETEQIENTPGGAKMEEILMYDSYPIW